MSFRSPIEVAQQPEWQPTTSVERYRHIDIIRGLALFGVLIINELTMFRIPLLEYILRIHTGQSWVDSAVEQAVATLLNFKALTIFSFLFGAGLAIQAERAAGRSSGPSSFLARRLTWLLLFGVVHLLVIWNGDILALYAVCGLMLSCACLGQCYWF